MHGDDTKIRFYDDHIHNVTYEIIITSSSAIMYSAQKPYQSDHQTFTDSHS